VALGWAFAARLRSAQISLSENAAGPAPSSTSFHVVGIATDRRRNPGLKSPGLALAIRS